MFSSTEKEGLGNEKKGAFIPSDRKKDHVPDGMTRKARLSDDSTPTRRKKVEEAKRKKQNGEYDSEEVYKKIADRLIDLFGI
jgi:anti-sigma28 factor (negative regulator of flagellin synthesis)